MHWDETVLRNIEATGKLVITKKSSLSEKLNYFNMYT